MPSAPTPPQESDLLLPFESQNMPARYKEYYATKRNNFFATIQGLPEIWNLYIQLDGIWLREFQDLQHPRDANWLFPSMLYINAHAKMRVSIELGMSGCMAEARSILRDAIEFVAHAHRMLSDPQLQVVWLNKADEAQAFKEAFERNKKDNLFKGLDELHATWGTLSEIGSHATLNSMCERLTADKPDAQGNATWRLTYSGMEPRRWAMSLFSMLLTCFTMERTLYGDYEARLKLDYELVNMREIFEEDKERLRTAHIARYHIEPPTLSRKM